ncbi:M15 family metallopeptidase, partial [Cellulomonas sp. P5_E12]
SCETTYSGPPFYTSPATVGGDGSNGKLPPEALTAISWDVDPHGTPYYLKNAAAAALERLDAAFRAAFGHHLDLDLTYRDYDTQVAMRAALGTVAAQPGTSTHGTGLALDVPELPCEYGWDTPQRSWLIAHGPAYGWTSPSWAGRNGSNPEYWHFEYVG